MVNYLKSRTQIIMNVMKDYGMEYETMDYPEGSSDMGNVSYRCPAFHPSVEITNKNIALHTKDLQILLHLKNPTLYYKWCNCY